ncbi:hypothetical protein KSP35_09150 [Aquihabitans sp. G128]|uniref:radical SAM protein n=1 Tax=Aquihabitans sp. G128 TaxID=2849779 RepID=UPI001C23D2F9|nr:radical SAM protein [Aquihabitans sp. G128]QXC62926.1 hypothetical protein KSP35_09150 [Aquihabitans sp. G128]
MLGPQPEPVRRSQPAVDLVAPPACFAPGSALYLRPDGLVMTCCGGWHLLGRVSGPGRRSLREIWDGPERAELQAALAAGSYELGCFACKVEMDHAPGGGSLAREFDRYGPEERRFPAMIDFALSDRCNLQCVQCSGTFSSSIRRHREGRPPLPAAYDERFFDELDEFLPHLERAQFKGGEPFLMRESRTVWDRMLARGLAPEISITTNGTIWNDKVERYTEDLGFDVIVSVDAVDPASLEAIRVGVDAERLWANIARFRRATARTGHSLVLSFCLMSINWQQLAPFLQACDRVGADPDVIWVGGPGNFSLLTVPRADLLDVLAGMERTDRALGPLSPAARAIWDDALGRVRGQVEGSASTVPVVLGSSRSAQARFDERIASAIDDLAGGDGAAVLRLHYVDELLQDVQAPAWSAWLQPEGWRGVGLRETLTTITLAAGGSVRSEVEELEGGAHRLVLTFEGEGPAGRARSIEGRSLPHPDDAGTICLLFAELPSGPGA